MTPPNSWCTLQQIADRFEDMKAVRVSSLARLVGIYSTVKHRRWSVTARACEYSPEAVGLIEREAKGRGYVLRVRLH